MEDLSRGMQQKVALARALLTSPALLLLDEPTTGLDPRSKREVQDFIRQVRRTHDTTTLLCTHDMAEAEALADRVGILDRGRELALFLWTVANTLTVVFIAKGVEATGGRLDVERQTASLLIGAVIWSYLGIVFEILTETVAWERWEGTIEYTFMAPLPRAVHLLGMGAFAVLYGVVRTAALFAVVALFFGLGFHGAVFTAALVLLAVASVSFVGLGMITAVL